MDARSKTVNNSDEPWTAEIESLWVEAMRDKPTLPAPLDHINYWYRADGSHGFVYSTRYPDCSVYYVTPADSDLEPELLAFLDNPED